MGNHSCACDFCHTNYKSEQNLSREYISTEKNSNKDSNISIFFQNKYMLIQIQQIFFHQPQKSKI